jgi:hypothetical protein
MSDTPNNENLPAVEEMDEIDKFLATLPPEEVYEDDSGEYEREIRPTKEKVRTPFTSFLSLLSWLSLLAGLSVAALAMPGRENFFHARTGTASVEVWKPEFFFNSALVLLLTLIICGTGLAVCAVKKQKMNSGTALSFWVSGGIAAVLAVVFLISGLSIPA